MQQMKIKRKTACDVCICVECKKAEKVFGGVCECKESKKQTGTCRGESFVWVCQGFEKRERRGLK